MSKFFAGTVSLESAIGKTETSGLDVLPTGARLTCSEGVFASERFADFVRKARSLYDVVIVDAPSLCEAKNAVFIGKQCDKMILTFEYGRSSMESLVASLSLLPKDIPSRAFVMNRYIETKKKNAREFSA